MFIKSFFFFLIIVLLKNTKYNVKNKRFNVKFKKVIKTLSLTVIYCFLLTFSLFFNAINNDKTVHVGILDGI